MGQYENSLGIDRPVIARVVTEDQRAVQRGQEPGGVILQRRGHTLAQSIAAEGVLYQSGIPFVIFAGDGGSNGLSFSGTRGVFTLSAETPMASSFNVLASGCYVYLPAGAGGLASGGWYWCVMTDGTNGEVFSNTYPGSGKPDFVASPTALANLSAGRITQITSEIYGPSFTMPGGSMGPNGILTSRIKYLTTSSAGTKYIRQKLGATDIVHWPITSTLNNQLFQSSRQNMGVQNRQIGNRTAATLLSAWDGGSGSTVYSNDITTEDTSVDQEVSFTVRVAVNTDSIIMIPMQVTVQYGG